MPRARERFPCPACGAWVEAGAASCRACGADERTGWAEEGEHADEERLSEAGVPRPMDDDEYERFVAEEFGGEAPRASRPTRWGVLMAVLFVGAVAALLALLLHGGRK